MSSSAYPSTENLYARDEETHKLIPGVFKRIDFAQVGEWLVTEKVDGTNIRIIFDRPANPEEENFSFDVAGRTDKANLPPKFREEALRDLDTSDGCDALLAALDAIDPTARAARMVIYGEGYGAGIQKGGGNYSPTKAFRMFDVRTYKFDTLLETDEDGQQRPVPTWHSPMWRTWEDVETVARITGLKTVPVVGVLFTTNQVVAYVGQTQTSVVGIEESRETPPLMEGVVARTDPYLYDFRGDRVMFKLKTCDL